MTSEQPDDNPTGKPPSKPGRPPFRAPTAGEVFEVAEREMIKRDFEDLVKFGCYLLFGIAVVAAGVLVGVGGWLLPHLGDLLSWLHMHL